MKPDPNECDRRVVELSKLASSMFPGCVFFIAVARLEEDQPIASIANVSTELQVQLLRALLLSFEQGTAAALNPVSLSGRG